MGKALLIIVLGAGLALSQQLYTAFLNESATGEDQVEYQENLIAREIAASAFNLGMGEIRAYGEDLQGGVRAFNGPGNLGRSGTFTTGRFAGGTYTVKAELTSAHSVRVVATGYFGRDTPRQPGEAIDKEDYHASFTMHDDYRVFVLQARRGGYIDVSFLESQAGYCSSVFYQAFTLDMPEGTTPDPVMLFAPDNRDRHASRPAQLLWVEPGTQMNFFIGVDQNCSMRPTQMTDVTSQEKECRGRAFARDYAFQMGDWDYLHHALEVEAGALDQVIESVWGLVEQKPDDRQRWRIGWEDIHNLSWNNPTSDNPANSFQALKRLGYDGDGWEKASAGAYSTLRDYGSRPDYSDQVIEIGVIHPAHPDFEQTRTDYFAQQGICGETVDEDPKPDAPVGGHPDAADEPSTADGGDTGTPSTGTPSTGTPSTGTPSTADGGDTGSPDDDGADDDQDSLAQFACDCTQNNTRNKVAILHRPPGNESNEQRLCVGAGGARAHERNHNDVFPSCTVQSSGGGKKK